jgi:hypothetical protein
MKVEAYTKLGEAFTLCGNKENTADCLQEKVSKKASGFSHVDELRSSTELNSSTVV